VQTFDVSRDDEMYEAFPDVAVTESGRLVCVFAECTHHADRSYTNNVVVTSDDRGRSWSAKRPLTDPHYLSGDGAFWDCPRVSRLGDGRLVAVVNEISGTMGSRDAARNRLYFSADEGETWDGPRETPVDGIVPDQLIELERGANAGRWVLAAHRTIQRDGEEVFEVRAWTSDDGGESWDGPVTVARERDLDLCEASVVEMPGGELVCFMRENSGRGLDAFKAISEDGGETWDGPYEMPLPGCHRPVAGTLDGDRVLVTHRFMQGGKGWLGTWTQNAFAALTDVESCLATDRDGSWTRILPLEFDRSPAADTGYTGWARFDDGEVYVVNYVVDDAPAVSVREPPGYDGDHDAVPKAFVRGYSLDLDDFVTDPDRLGPGR